MISDRLAAIAYMIDKNKVVFDVGSDHGLLPIFLVESGICPKAYAGDNKLGPLETAKKNIESANLVDKVIPVYADGLPQNINDIDIVTIAGLGYYTIEHILDNADISKYQYLIVQTNSDVELLRKYISDHLYTIEDERIIFDDFYYQIIKFSADMHDPYSDLEIKYGPILLKKEDHIFLNYLNDKKDKLIDINNKANKDIYKDTIEEIEMILNHKGDE